MGIFGASARLRDKSLANPEQYQPMFAPTISEAQPITDGGAVPQDFGSAMQAPQMKRPGLFSRGGMGWDIVGSLGDALAQMGGYAPIYAHNQALLRKQQADEELYQRQRNDKFADWQQQYEYERTHPKAVNNDTVADYEFIRQRLGDDAANEYLRNRASGGFVGVDVQQADGSVIRQFYPKSGLPSAGGASGPPPGHVEDGYRFKGGNPADPNAWEQVGGAGPQTPRPFPR